MSRRRAALDWALRVAVAAGLAIDCYVHANLAGFYDANAAAISQGQLFRVEAGLAAAAVLVVLLVRNRLGAAVAALVAGGGLFAVLLFRYVPVGAFGPFPMMYEPIWYAEKVVSAVAEGVAAALAVILFFTTPIASKEAAVAGPRRSLIGGGRG